MDGRMYPGPGGKGHRLVATRFFFFWHNFMICCLASVLLAGGDGMSLNYHIKLILDLRQVSYPACVPAHTWLNGVRSCFSQQRLH